MDKMRFKLDPKADPAKVHSEHLGPNAPDLASAVFQLARNVCAKLGPNVCPFRGALLDGRCPAGSCEPCPAVKEAGSSTSYQNAVKEAAKLDRPAPVFGVGARAAAPVSAKPKR